MEEEKKLDNEQALAAEEPAAPKSAKDTYREAFAEDYPDVDMDDEEAFYGQLSKNRDRHKKTQADFEAMNTMMAENPNAGYFMNDLFSGKSGDELTASFLENFGETFKDAIEDPSEENVKKFGEALKKNADKIRENEEFQAQWAENDAESLETIEQFKQEKGLDDEAIEGIKQSITDFVAKFASGIIDTEMLEAVYKLQNYDADMQKAEAKGQTAGRNSRIKENLRKSQGDGVPMLSGNSSTPSETPKKKNDDIFALANMAR